MKTENHIYVSRTFEQLLKLEDNWYEGQGKKYDRELLSKFATFFKFNFDSIFSVQAILPLCNWKYLSNS